MLAVFARRALASGDLMAFPEKYAQGVHYATVKRGNITEELYTSREPSRRPRTASRCRVIP